MHLPYNYLYMWGCTSVDIIFFLFRWDELVQIPNPRNRKAAFTFRIAFSFQRFWLINFLLAHVTSSESEIRGFEMLFFSVYTASSIACGLCSCMHHPVFYCGSPCQIQRQSSLQALHVMPEKKCDCHTGKLRPRTVDLQVRCRFYRSPWTSDHWQTRHIERDGKGVE